MESPESNSGQAGRGFSVAQLGVMVGVSVGVASLLFTPFAVVLVPAAVVGLVVMKMLGGGGSSASVQGDAQVKAPVPAVSPAAATDAPTPSIEGGSTEPEIAADASKPRDAAAEEQFVENDEAPPPQPAITGPSRRSVELLAGSALTKTVTASSANPSLHSAGTGQISNSGTGPLTAAPPAAAAAPAPTAAAPALPTPAASAPPAAQTADRSADDTPAPPASNSAPAQAAQAPAAAQPAAAAAAAPSVAATGGAAILARLRQQRTDTPKSLNTTPAPAPASQVPAADAAPAPAVSDAKPAVVVLYGSQTGTCQEIARNLAAEALEKGYNATCASMNEHGFPSVSPTRSPYLIVVAASTGDGDPPDNAAAFYVALRKKGSDAEKPLTGVRFTVLGLGDSNYTRFMYVPRVIKTRLAELGAGEFYPCAEADEVDGVENTVEPWTEGLWDALAKVMVAGGKGGEGAGVVKEAAAPVVQVAEVPPPPAAVATAAAAAAAAVVVAERKAEEQEQKQEKEKAEEDQERAAEPEELPAPAAEPPAAEQAQQQEAGQQQQGEEQQAEVTPGEEQQQQEQEEQAAQPQVEEEAAPADGSVLPTQEAAASDLPPTAESGVDDAGSGQQLPATPQPPASPPSAADADGTADDGAAGSAEGSPLSPPLPEYDDRDLLTPRSEVVGDLGLGPDSPRADSVASGASGAMGAGAKNFRKSVELRRTAHDLANRRKSIEKPPGRLQAKPISVNFPKRDETVVKRKDEKSYGLLLGLAPVGVDTKGAPALLPARIKLSYEKDEAKAKAVLAAEAAVPTREQRHALDPTGAYSAAQPFWAHIAGARYETAFWSDRKVLHLELSIRGSGMAYEPGDSIGVLPLNPPDLVAGLCKRLSVSPDKVLHVNPASASASGGAEGAPQPAAHIPSPCSVGWALSRCVDLTGVTKKSVLRLLAEHCSDAAEKRTLLYFAAKGGKEAYAHEITEHQPSVLDLLQRFRSCRVSLEALLDALPPLTPRMYSISCSRREGQVKAADGKGATRVSVALSVVRFKTRYGTRLGVASSWLDRLAQPWTQTEGAVPAPDPPVWVPVFLRRAADFKPPASLATPLVMVGPGTGVAPFRGFLQERRARIQEEQPAPEALGEAVLFFGCRREDEDYLYREDLEAFKADGTLSALHVAFSRQQADKVYVQDLMKAQGAKLWSLLSSGAHLYVCGDGASMAKDVHAALGEIAVAHGGLAGQEEATAFLQKMTEERRYVRDIWS